MRVHLVAACVFVVGLHCASDARAATITLSNAFSNSSCSTSSTYTDVAATVPLATLCSTTVFTGNALAEGSFIGSSLTLGTFATLTITNRDLDTYDAGAGARFQDTLFPDVTGFAEFTLEVEGSVSCSGPCNFTTGPWASMLMFGRGIFFAFEPSGASSSTLPPTIATFSLPLVAGEPVALSIAMSASAHIENAFPGARATADFSNTATLLSVSLLDANNQPIPGGSLISESGLIYPLVTPVPEPSTLLLLGSGAIGIMSARRRRGRAQSHRG